MFVDWLPQGAGAVYCKNPGMRVWTVRQGGAAEVTDVECGYRGDYWMQELEYRGQSPERVKGEVLGAVARLIHAVEPGVLGFVVLAVRLRAYLETGCVVQAGISFHEDDDPFVQDVPGSRTGDDCVPDAIPDEAVPGWLRDGLVVANVMKS